MSITISTHVLDTSAGRPAGGVEIELAQQTEDGAWQVFAGGTTNSDGRAGKWTLDAAPPAGALRLTFATGAYFQRQGVATFYPAVTIEFRASAGEHYHVPLLLSPFGYTTYRGS